MATILQICNTDFYLSRFLAPLVLRLVERGHQVDCVCEGVKIAPELIEAGVRVHSVSFPRGSAPLCWTRTIQNIRRIIREGGFMCVNSHNRNASIAGRLASWWERVPLNVYTAHGFYFHDDQGPAAKEATVWLEGLLARATSFTLSQSDEDTRWMVARGLIAKDRIHTVGNGIDEQRFVPAPNRKRVEDKLALKSGRFRVGTVGRVVRGKGFGDLLDAFVAFSKTRSDTELLLVGGNITQDLDPFADEFLRKVRACGLQDRVIMTGMTDEVDAYLQTMDVFALPSYREGLPRVVLEAMSTGLPVLATDIRGCREAVVHGETGFLFFPHDTKTLERYLGRIYDFTPERRADMGLAGRSRVLKRFTERQYIDAQVEQIERLILEAAPRSKTWQKQQ